MDKQGYLRQNQQTKKRKTNLDSNTVVEKAVRRHKNNWIETLVQSAQTAAELKNTRELYRITKQLTNKKLNTDNNSLQQMNRKNAGKNTSTKV